jgi:phosphate-selective porin OprO/OprP
MLPTKSKHSKGIAVIAAGLIASGSAIAGVEISAKNPVPQPEAAPPSICDIFDYATLYDNKENAVLQKFSFTGRLQADAAFFDGGDSDYEELLWRRVRAGFKADVFQDFVVHSEVNWDLNSLDPAYAGLTDSYIGWSSSEEFSLKVGKQGAAFTGDGATSSKKLLTLERNMLSENLWFPVEYYTGITAGGTINGWYYNIGGFSSTADLEFSEFDAGYFGLISIGYDFAQSGGLDKALVRLDYVYNEENPGNGTRSLANIVSLNGQFESGRAGVWTDIAFGDGYGSQSDIFALSITPFYNLTDKLQLVGSYNFATSSGDNGIRLTRYENRTVSGRANEANEFFAGVNYYFCSHKLKWQTGVEYTTSSDDANDGGEYNGWGLTSGIRLYW